MEMQLVVEATVGEVDEIARRDGHLRQHYLRRKIAVRRLKRRDRVLEHLERHRRIGLSALSARDCGVGGQYGELK